MTKKKAKKALPDAWALAATAAIHSLASEKTRFTSDDVWRLIGGTPEPRRLGARLQEAERNLIIRKGPLEQSTRAARHKAPIRVWISNKNEPIEKDRETKRRELQIALEAVVEAIKTDGFQLSANWLDSYGGLHKLDSGYQNQRLVKLEVVVGFPSEQTMDTLQAGIRSLIYEASRIGYGVALTRCGEYGSEEVTTFDSSSRIVVSDRVPVASNTPASPPGNPDNPSRSG